MNEEILKAMRGGTAILFLGAGASRGSLTSNGKDEVPLGSELAEQLAAEFGLPFANDSVADVYAACMAQDKARTENALLTRFKDCRPSAEYSVVSTVAWRRIYTTNIDDAFERVRKHHHAQAIQTRGIRSKIEPLDASFRTVDYIKLNGSITELNHGLIFSPTEYGRTAAQGQLWYDELAKDFFNYTFIFVGTQLNEPLFHHHVERYRSLGHDDGPKAYLLTPEVSSIKRAAFAAAGISHIEAVLKDFATWIKHNLPDGLTYEQAFVGQNPQLVSRTGALTLAQPVMIGLEPVNRASIAQWIPEEKSARIRRFYQGFKPNWREIVDEVPASLKANVELFAKLDAEKDRQLVVVVGPAGSGKTTLLMQTALTVADRWGVPCFYMGQEVTDIKGAIAHLAKVLTTPFYIFTDQLDEFADRIRAILDSNRYPKLRIVASERSQIWGSRVAARLGDLCSAPYQLQLITDNDATEILDKLQRFGPWTRLGKLRPSERPRELYTKSKRQLLIGLLEATLGKGFDEIIQSEYTSLSTANLRRFVLLVGLATVHRLPMPMDLLSSGLVKLKIKESPYLMIEQLQGIVNHQQNYVVLRHPIYARRIFEKHASVYEMDLAVTALLEAFAAFQSPVVQHVAPPLDEIYRRNINHRFLSAIYKRTEKALELYQKFEKAFEPDGLYWLHYGLALRDVGRHEDALGTLRTAITAYASEQTVHAYAQQLFIVAREIADKARAESLVNEAVEMLRNLHKQRRRQGDLYPIVLLSEGHVSAYQKLRGDTDARVLARQYANEIEPFKKRAVPTERIHETWKRLTDYSTTGRWASFDYATLNWFSDPSAGN